MIIAKHLVGKKVTHNGDGFYTRAWRLHADGRVERTNSRSRYVEHLAGETIPAGIVEAARAAGIAIQPGRQVTRRGPGRWKGHHMRKGDTVEVYEYPLTQQKHEGTATFIRWIGAALTGQTQRRAEVLFPGIGEESVERWISVDAAATAGK
jgi:hypothetical protein